MGTTVPFHAEECCHRLNNKKAQLMQRSARDSVGIVAPPGESEYNAQNRLLAKFPENSNVRQFKVIQGG